MPDTELTPGQAARAAWGAHWATATQRGRGTPGYNSLADEDAAWEAAAIAGSAEAAAEAADWARRCADAMAERDELSGLVADILQSLPDTADEQEWRDLAGAAGVTDPGGQPYRALTEEDL